MLRDVCQDARERAYAKIGVAGDRDMVLAVFGGCQAKVATGLPGHAVAKAGERVCEIVSGDVPRQSHAVMTSSRTKCKRMTFGS
jgi:hypothetical protein